MAERKQEPEVEARIAELARVVEEQGRALDEQRVRLAAVEGGGHLSGLLHARKEPATTSRRDLLRRAGIAAAAATAAGTGLVVLDQHRAAAATGGNFILGNANDADAPTTLAPTTSTTPHPVLAVTGANQTVALKGAGTGKFSTFTFGIGVLGTGVSGAVGVQGSASGSADLSAGGSGRIHQAAGLSGPPAFTPFEAEQWRDHQGVLWLSDGKFGWAPAAFGGMNIAVYSAVITTQPQLFGNDGVSWTPMEGTNLKIIFTPKFHAQAIVTVNADLWTSTAGVNQDIGVSVSSSTAPPGVGLYPTTASQPEAWKESGGKAGTFSPNAAYLQTVLPVRAGITYTFTVVWKNNINSPSATIWAGAGPIGGKYSPTRMTIHLIADSHANVGAAASTPRPRSPRKPKTKG